MFIIIVFRLGSDKLVSCFFYQGRVDDLSFLDYVSLFCFLLIKFHLTFSMYYKIVTNYYCNLVKYCLTVKTSFFRARFASFHTHVSLLISLSFSLSYFILAFPMQECLGKHSCMSS